MPTKITDTAPGQSNKLAWRRRINEESFLSRGLDFRLQV